MELSVSEPYSPYDYVRQFPPYPSYDCWDALTVQEQDAVRSFQDLGSKQDAWDVKAPDLMHVNCSIVNSYLRHYDFREMMSDSDLILCKELISLLDSAISKSVIPRELNVIRGLTNPSWAASLEEGMMYLEPGYGSYSLSVDVAVRYARMNNEGKMVFFARPLEIGDTALYLGSKEEEMLVGRGHTYVIDEINQVEKGMLSPVCESIVYMLERTNY